MAKEAGRGACRSERRCICFSLLFRLREAPWSLNSLACRAARPPLPHLLIRPYLHFSNCADFAAVMHSQVPRGSSRSTTRATTRLPYRCNATERAAYRDRVCISCAPMTSSARRYDGLRAAGERVAGQGPRIGADRRGMTLDNKSASTTTTHRHGKNAPRKSRRPAHGQH